MYAARTPLSLLIAACVVAAGALPLSVQAKLACSPADQDGMERCVVGLTAPQIGAMYQAQEKQNWCWAASVAMILKHYGAQVPQEQIVTAQFSQPLDLGAQSTEIGFLLDRKWTDPAGRTVEVEALPVPSWRMGYGGLSAPEVLQDLEAGRPLVLIAHDHAMVLVEILFQRPVARPGRVEVLRAAVLDPGNYKWLRSATGVEQAPSFLLRTKAVTPTAATTLD